MAPQFTVCFIVCGIVWLMAYSSAAPQSREDLDAFGWGSECVTSIRILEICQKCAIKSKSNIVYPMCCEGREEAREWCVSFLAYGHHNS